MPYGLKDIELEKLSKVFAANERIERVVLYGSRAKGNYKPFSDVDITMMGSELTHTDLNRISFAIDDLLLPYQFDISIFHTLKNEALIDHIHRVGIAIYERESEWKEYKLGEIAEVIGGGTPDTSNAEYWNGDIPWLTPKDLTGYNGIFISKGERYITKKGLDNSSAKLLPPGTVLLSSRAPIGYVAIASNSICTNQGFKSIICNPQIVDNLFMYYWIKNNVEYLQSLGTGTTFAEISGSVVKSINVVIPSLDIQHRIASILTSLDDKIELLRRENATLETMAETLFRQWFVVEAKKEWEEGKLGDYVDETIGGEWGKENPEGDFIKPVQCIRGTDIADLSVGLATKTPIRYVKESKFEKIEPRNGDIIMEISGGTENQSTGRVAYINEDVKKLFDYPIIFSNFCRLLRVKEEHTYFIYCYLKYLYDQDEFFNLENGSSGIKNLDYKALLFELTYPMPNDRQQILDFNDKVSVYFEKINRNKQQIQTLIQTRDGLLPRLMGGELKI